MRKSYILIALFLLITSFLTASTGDSLHFLTPTDTIFISNSKYGEKIFTHTLEKGQTVYSLARFYGLKLENLKAYNESFEDKIISPGTKIIIPIPNKAIKRFETLDLKSSPHIPICYVVKNGDTMYGIAKRDYKMPIDTLVKRNKLASEILQPGQILHVGWLDMSGIPDSLRSQNQLTGVWRINKLNEGDYRKNSLNKKIYEERGAAIWSKNQAKGNENEVILARHKYAKIGSFIEIYNPMNDRVVYAKVVARIPAGVYESTVVTVLSPLTAKMLGAIDPKFFVEIKYHR